MTNDQRKFLQNFCQEYPPAEWKIRTIEYPAGITVRLPQEKHMLDTVKVVYTLNAGDPDRIYVDYIGKDGFPVHTESRKLSAA